VSERTPEHGFTHLGDSLVHQGYIWHLVTAQFEAPSGERFVRDIVRSPGAVGIVPISIDASGGRTVTLLRQYRPALDAELIEIPAGMRDVEGEPPELTAQRELAEEIGRNARQLELLTVFHNSAGMTNSTTHVFLATDLVEVPAQAHGPEEEAMSVFHVGFDQALAQVASGEITDAKTVIGLLLAAQRLG
jgi:ADP-ribose pyrophosphatase